MAVCNLLERLTRKKRFSAEQLKCTNLKRTLTTFDLAALGVGSTLGVGVYVLAGEVAKSTAGPSVVVSFAIAALASVLAGLCYAEFGARVPRAGSAYVYSYVCVGELMAFVIGWDLILENLIGCASVARAYSSYLDALLSKRMQAAFLYVTPLHVWMENQYVAEYVSPYVDFFAFALCLLVASLLSFGVKESSRFTTCLTVLNLVIILFVITAGSFRADFSNWQVDPNSSTTKLIGNHTREELGRGGFFPFGISGMLAGAATCFYGFVGFDVVATTGEETKNPQKSIPIAIVVSLTVIFLAYFGISTVLTLMWPYYDQDPNAPLPSVFEALGWTYAKWIVSIGALFGLSTSVTGAMFPIPRVVYAMANDGLLFRSLARVDPRTQTPLLATMLAGLFGGVIAAVFDLKALVDMMSIGTLMAYTLVAVCVLVLRYDEDSRGPGQSTKLLQSRKSRGFGFGFVVRQLVNAKGAREPSRLSSRIVTSCTFLLVLQLIAINALLIFKEDLFTEPGREAWAIVIFVVLILFTLGVLTAIKQQPQSSQKLQFKAPFVPLLPATSIWINLYLMMKLSGKTWQRFAVWQLIGSSIYFLYGMRESSEERNRGSKQDESPLEETVT